MYNMLINVVKNKIMFTDLTKCYYLLLIIVYAKVAKVQENYSFTSFMHKQF